MGGCLVRLESENVENVLVFKGILKNSCKELSHFEKKMIFYSCRIEVAKVLEKVFETNVSIMKRSLATSSF